MLQFYYSGSLRVIQRSTKKRICMGIHGRNRVWEYGVRYGSNPFALPLFHNLSSSLSFSSGTIAEFWTSASLFPEAATCCVTMTAEVSVMYILVAVSRLDPWAMMLMWTCGFQGLSTAQEKFGSCCRVLPIFRVVD